MRSSVVLTFLLAAVDELAAQNKANRIVPKITFLDVKFMSISILFYCVVIASALSSQALLLLDNKIRHQQLNYWDWYNALLQQKSAFPGPNQR
jgi:hypothetical protein